MFHGILGLDRLQEKGSESDVVARVEPLHEPSKRGEDARIDAVVQLQSDAELVRDISLRLVAGDVVHLQPTHARRRHQQRHTEEITTTTMVMMILYYTKRTAQTYIVHTYKYTCLSVEIESDHVSFTCIHGKVGEWVGRSDLRRVGEGGRGQR